MNSKTIDSSLGKMTPEQLQKGIHRWLTGGRTTTERDETILRKVTKAREKEAQKKAAKSNG
jgi:hypothetical protein